MNVPNISSRRGLEGDRNAQSYIVVLSLRLPPVDLLEFIFGRPKVPLEVFLLIRLGSRFSTMYEWLKSICQFERQQVNERKLACFSAELKFCHSCPSSTKAATRTCISEKSLPSFFSCSYLSCW